MSTDPTDNLKTAMMSLRKSRAPAPAPAGAGPAGAAAPPPPAGAKPTGKPMAKPKTKATGGSGRAKPKGTASPRPTGGSDRPAPPILVPEIIDDDPCGSKCGIPEPNLKEHFTEKELLFIEIFLAGGCSRMEAMISAGYTEGNLESNHYRARKIISKYESLAGEHRKTFRAVGAGEVAVAQGLLELATTSKSEMVRLNAWTAIGKILGLTQDVVAVNQGIQIVIKGRGEGPGRPAAQDRQEAPRVPPRTMAIIK